MPNFVGLPQRTNQAHPSESPLPLVFFFKVSCDPGDQEEENKMESLGDRRRTTRGQTVIKFNCLNITTRSEWRKLGSDRTIYVFFLSLFPFLFSVAFLLSLASGHYTLLQQLYTSSWESLLFFCGVSCQNKKEHARIEPRICILPFIFLGKPFTFWFHKFFLSYGF